MSCPARGVRLVLLCLTVELVTGCATYSDSLLEVRAATDAGDYATAIRTLDTFVDESALGRDTPLVLLERGLLLQADERFEDSARDFSTADEALEWLDLSENALHSIGEYVYSDSSGPYLSPPSERLALNGFNLLNYLVRGDLSGAAVEARRYTVMREYLESRNISHRSPLGAYLAGFVFDRRGEGDRALRYYDEALAAGAPASALQAPVSRLASRFPYRTERLRELAAESGSASRADQELLIVVATGRVPFKVPMRIPVGAAVGLAGTFITGDIGWLDRGITKVVVYPELVAGPPGSPPRAVSVNGEPLRTRLIDQIGAEVTREYQVIKPRIIGAALSRVIARAIASEGIRAASQDAGGWGSVAAIAVEAAMVALDRPDTRSWTLLPNQVSIARVSLPAGSHSVAIELEGETREYSVEVAPDGFSVVVFTAPY